MPPPRFYFLGFLLVLAWLLSSAAGVAESPPDFSAEKLTGDWDGRRSRLWQGGWDVGLTYKAGAWRNVAGGLQRQNRVLDNLDVEVAFDGGRALGRPGLTAFIHFLNNNGRGPNALVGSNGGLDNIEVAVPASKLYSAWVQQEFQAGKISVLAGLHDLNSEFYVTESSGLFLNPTYGISTEMSATGDNGPSIFPTTSLGLRLAMHATGGSYLQVAAYDGVPGDVNHPHGTHVDFQRGEGALLVAEAGGHGNDGGHLAAGAWCYTAERPDTLTGAPARSQGVYFLTDQPVYENRGRKISLFARAGITAGDVEQFKHAWSAGVLFSGFVPGRQEGKFGLAFATATNAAKFNAVNGPLAASEFQAELTYQDRLRPGLSVQPDLQYTVHPGANPAVKNAWTVGLRVTIDL